MLKLLCGAHPSDSHHLRYLELLNKAGVETHLLDHSADFVRRDLPVSSHRRWPGSGRRTLGKILGPEIANRLADWTVCRQLKFAWRKSRADVCHIHWIDERPFYAAMAGLHPLVVTAYGSDLNRTRLPEYDRSLLEKVKRGLAEVDLFIADSEDMIALAQELAGRDLNSLLLPIGVDTSLFRPGYEAEARAWRAELAIPEDAPIILSPRIMRPNYRHAKILRAFASAVQNNALDAFIVFKTHVGDSICVEEIQAIAAAEGIQKRIRIIGEVAYNKLPVLYAMSDLAINLPIMDAFPVTFIECSACQLPILTNRLAAYSSNGMEDFLTFTEGEGAAAIGRQMALMCGNEAVLAKARAARDHAVRHFDEKTFISALLSAYGGLLSAKRAS